MYSMEKLKMLINSTHISDLIPINELNKKNNNLYKDYMLSCITYEEIINKYPFLKDEPLYASKSISEPCYYYDKESLFPISLYPEEIIENNITNVKPVLLCLNSGSEETEYKERVSFIKQKFKEGKGLSFINSNTMAFEFLNANISNIDKNKLFDMVINLYIHCDYGFNILNRDVIKTISESRTEKHYEKLRKKLSKYPDEITIYRGEGEFSTENGYSYSLNINIACFFASRFSGSKKGRIIKGKIKKEDIIWYDNNRDEEEVIVNPEKIYDKEEIKMLTVFDNEFHLCMDGANDFYQLYRGILKEFPYTHKGNDHNKEHMLRVLFLGLLILTKDCPNIHIDDTDAHTLAMALALHDIGRNNDGDDTEHGIISYNMLKKHLKKIIRLDKDMYNDEWVQFLMEYHCKDDKLAMDKIRSMNLEFGDRMKLITFYNILKDADALDRVRFGIKCLDVKYLRMTNSIEYVLLANQLKNTLKL